MVACVLAFGEPDMLHSEICAIVVIEAELACQPANSRQRWALARQRDRLLNGLSLQQIAQLRRVASSLSELMMLDPAERRVLAGAGAPDWRTRHDSNVRPLPSEGSALSS